MKTAKLPPSDLSSSRRAQPVRQARNNPPRSSISLSRPFGSRDSLAGGMDSAPSPNQPIEIFPAITHFADAITALPKELVRHFTLLKEVDAKIFGPEEHLGNLVEAALNAPLPERRQPIEAHQIRRHTSAPMSAQGSLNGSVSNSHVGSVVSAPDIVMSSDLDSAAWDPANLPRRQLFQQCAFTMQNMLVSLDEKNHVISTANEALNKQLARIDDIFPYIDLEISEEARYGSLTHWAYAENRVAKTSGGSRRDAASVNHLSAAAQHLAEEAAARSDARKQALLAKKARHAHADSDFDDQQESKHKGEVVKKTHGNSKVRRAPEAGIGLGITNGTAVGGAHPQKRRKVEKTSSNTNTGATMERSLSSAQLSNGVISKTKAGSPIETPTSDAAKKKSRGTAPTSQTRKRNNTINSVAMSPSIASSPIRSTFPELKAAGRLSPAPVNGGRPTSSRARQNSTQSAGDNIKQKSEVTLPIKTNGTTLSVSDASGGTGTPTRTAEVKVVAKDSTTSSKGEPAPEKAEQEQDVVAATPMSRKGSAMKREDTESNGDAMQGIQPATVTTKSGRASKPSTPAMPSFPEPTNTHSRSRSSRNALEATSNNKRSHKKGASAAAQLIAQQNSEQDDTASSVQGDDEDQEIDADEPTYCYCNGVSYGEMVACDADGCEKEWFHLECVGLKVAPRGNAKWYCDDCKEKLKIKRFNGR